MRDKKHHIYLDSRERIILLHSLAQQFARLYPDMVKGIVLLDPLSANDNQFKQQLTEKSIKKCASTLLL